MNGILQNRGVLSHIADVVHKAPVVSFLVFSVFVILITRLKTGYANSKLRSQNEIPSKSIPIFPYWLPYLGHAPSFAWDFDALLTKGRNATKDGIFGLHLLGVKHYVVLMPSLTKQFFLQRHSVLSSDDFIFRIYETYFGDGGAAKAIPHDDYHAVHRVLNSLMHEPFLSTATEKTTRMIEDRSPSMLSLSTASDQQPQWQKNANSAVDENIIEVDLFPLIMYFVGEIAGTVLMGQQLFANNPGIFQDILVLDGAFSAFLTGLPTPTLRTAKAARARLNEAFNEWNHALSATLNGDDPSIKWGDLSDVSEVMKARLKALNKIGSPDAFSIASQLAVYWGLMVNSNKIIFWLLLHIISTPVLSNSIRKEIHPYVSFKNGGLKLDADSILKDCPLFKATFYETMRLCTAGTSYKKVMQDITLTESDEDAQNFGKQKGQTYHIKAGNFLVIQHSTMQTDPRLWANPSTFSPERFLITDEKDPSVVKANIRHLNAFGGGHSMCKGRYYAEREVLMFVAGLLATWDFAPAGKDWEMPGRFYNGTGTANPKSNVRVRMSKRTF